MWSEFGGVTGVNLVEPEPRAGTCQLQEPYSKRSCLVEWVWLKTGRGLSGCGRPYRIAWKTLGPCPVKLNRVTLLNKTQEKRWMTHWLLKGKPGLAMAQACNSSG